MNGAQALLRTLLQAGVTTCFTNPGTSEMHFVAALDSAPEMRAVLTVFEGVATGAADGYARMASRPAATLLHLGPGLGNGVANLHNARKGEGPGREHRRRPRDLPRQVRRPAPIRHRDHRAQRLRVGADFQEHRRPESRRRRSYRRCARAPRTGGDADRARGRRLGRRGRAGPAPATKASPGTGRGRDRLGRRGRCGGAAGPRCCSAGGPCARGR